MEIAIILIGAMLLDALIVIGPTIVLSLVGFPRLSLFAALAVVMLLFVDQSVNFEHLSLSKNGNGEAAVAAQRPVSAEYPIWCGRLGDWP